MKGHCRALRTPLNCIMSIRIVGFRDPKKERWLSSHRSAAYMRCDWRSGQGGLSVTNICDSVYEILPPHYQVALVVEVATELGVFDQQVEVGKVCQRMVVQTDYKSEPRMTGRSEKPAEFPAVI